MSYGEKHVALGRQSLHHELLGGRVKGMVASNVGLGHQSHRREVWG